MSPTRGRRRVEFLVEGELPPKKDGANSMWAKRSEVPRLIALRRAAVQAMAGLAPFHRDISLELEVCCPPGLRAGDLDNFITGVCDGLMAADPRIKRDARWESPDCVDIYPTRTLAIADDGAVVSIVARKVLRTPAPGYRVILEGA